MKKIFSILVVGLLSATLGAQQLNESFEDAQFAPEGWSTIDSDSYCAWRRVSKDDNTTLSVFDGRACAVVPGCYSTENYLITPQLRPSAGEKLHFAARVKEYSSKGMLKIEVSTNGTEKTSFVELASFSTSSNIEGHLWKSDWQEYNIDLGAYAGQRIFVAFHQVGEAENIYVDAVSGVTLAGDAECESPYNVTISAIRAGGATFVWDGEAAQYQYICVLAENQPDWSKATLTSEKTAVIGGLYESAAYAFYVRAYCSEELQSLAPVVNFKTPCTPEPIPYVETFYHHSTGEVEPECWTVASAKPQVWVVSDKSYDDEGGATLIRGSEHIYAAGGGPTTVQVFAMPALDAVLNTLEVAFDYKNSIVNANYGVLEIGYMTNPSNAASFVSLKTFPQVSAYTRETVELSAVPEEARFIAFRFAGGTSDFAGVSMDDFVVAPIGHSEEYKPETIIDDADAYLLATTYCEAQFSWYAYNVTAFGIGLFNSETEQQIAAIFATTEECDLFAYYDGVAFSEYEDPDNHYYCSTKWILNADESGLMKFEGWEDAVINVGTASTPLLGLKSGKYQVQIYKYTAGASSLGDKIGTVPFELTEKKVTNLQATVADDKQTATLTWDTPQLANGERLYVRVWAGETVAFDNYDAPVDEVATSPLVVDVIEGKTYAATIQVIDRQKNPLGSEVQCDFTVGVNPYEPTDPHAEVFSGDNVTFTWRASVVADRYVITLFHEGEFYSTLTVLNMTKTTTMPVDGTWTWTVQAFNRGTNGNYFEASAAVEGNSFVTKAADIPEDAIVLNVWGMEAAFLDEDCEYYQAGKNGWYLTFATGDEDGTGYPLVSFLIYTTKRDAISGTYNVARQNIDLESCYLNTNGLQSGAIWSTDAEIRLRFEGFDEEYFAQGYAYGYYTGQFGLVGDDGKTYVAKFMELFCNSYDYSSLTAAYLNHHGMWDEDPEAPEGIENVNQKSEITNQKQLIDGQLVIIRDGVKYNAQGAVIR